jgi:hypothetical protein
MMTNVEFETYLQELGLTQTEAARLLSVNGRTVRRWVDGTVEIPGSVEQAVRAWIRLEELGLAWRPDSEMIGAEATETLAQQIAAYRKHALDLDSLLRRVKARGGPAAPWVIDLAKRRATLGPIEVTFYPLTNGGFSPCAYARRDRPPDQQRDWPLIEDAIACIANAIRAAGKNWAY